jgi:hypothetical protein
VFFLLFGTRPKVSQLVVVRFICSYCGIDAPQHVNRRSTQFTLFFVPLFSFGKNFFVRCTNCGGTTGLTEQQAQHSLEWAAQRGA